MDFYIVNPEYKLDIEPIELSIFEWIIKCPEKYMNSITYKNNDNIIFKIEINGDNYNFKLTKYTNDWILNFINEDSDDINYLEIQMQIIDMVQIINNKYKKYNDNLDNSTLNNLIIIMNFIENVVDDYEFSNSESNNEDNNNEDNNEDNNEEDNNEEDNDDINKQYNSIFNNKNNKNNNDESTDDSFEISEMSFFSDDNNYESEKKTMISILDNELEIMNNLKKLRLEKLHKECESPILLLDKSTSNNEINNEINNENNKLINEILDDATKNFIRDII